MDEPIKSHVQIPKKAILKHFSFREIEFNENKKPLPLDFVYCLD